jgi:hypothetical protein
VEFNSNARQSSARMDQLLEFVAAACGIEEVSHFFSRIDEKPDGIF